MLACVRVFFVLDVYGICNCTTSLNFIELKWNWRQEGMKGMVAIVLTERRVDSIQAIRSQDDVTMVGNS